jgi:hypothetical protein
LGDERALRVLLEHLGDSRFLVRSAAIEAVTAFGDRAVASLIEMLVPSTVPTEPLLREASEASSQRVRLRAMQALGELRNPNAVSGLKVLAEDPDPQVAAAAEDALSMVGCAAWGRACAAVALGSLRAKRAVRPLLRSLRDPSHNVRSAAVRALGKTGDWRFFRAIGSVLAKDQDPEVRAEAALVLQRSGRRGKGCVQAALTAMADESRVVRRRAATALGRYQDAAAVPALVAGLADRYWSVRRDCENALANLGRAAVPGLLASLRKADQPVGRSILGILVRIRPPDLSACLQKEIPRIREAALREGAESVVAELSQSAPPRNNTRPSPR